MIKSANNDDQLKSVYSRIVGFEKNRPSTQDHNTSSSSFSRQQLLDTRFNPLVIPDSEQILFVEYLNDTRMGLVSFMAPQGAGKTIFALASGLRQVRKGLYDKIIYARPVVVIGEDTGYNPGKPSEKIKPLMMSCEDAIAKLYCMSESQDFYNTYSGHKISDNNAFFNGLFEQNILDYQVLTNMAGRTLSRAFVIMDEAHLLNREQLRLFLGRIGEDSKCVLLGDYAQLGAANADVVRKYNLTLDKLGMSHLIEKVLVNNNKEYTDIYGHISINRPYTRRSRVAAIGNIL
jgi:predicted ribonuclease YlaK